MTGSLSLGLGFTRGGLPFRALPGVRYDPAFAGPRAAERVTTMFVPGAAAPPRGALRPGILVIYGGGFTRAAPGVPLHVGRYFAAQGFVVSVVEYRAVYSSTQGTAPDDGVTALDATADVCAALAHLADYDGVDPGNLVVIGHSTGGQIASAITTNPGHLAAVGVSLSQVSGVIPIDHGSYSLDAFGGHGPTLSRSVDSVSADLTRTWGFTRTPTPNANSASTLPLGQDSVDSYDSREIYYPGFLPSGDLSPGDPQGYSPVFYVNDDLPPQWIPYVGRLDGTDGAPAVGGRAGQALAWRDLVASRPRVAASGGVGLYPRQDYAQHDEMITELGTTGSPEARAYTEAALAALVAFTTGGPVPSAV